MGDVFVHTMMSLDGFIAGPDLAVGAAGACLDLARRQSEMPENSSAPGKIRTCDLSLRRRALYPLSYGRRRRRDDASPAPQLIAGEMCQANAPALPPLP
ncbi:MAG: hypothetical protein QOI89_1295 [Solirubrobacteraceae bacterium]|nr:hypothetical protein [Solirubrobacteraceae bacterium]